MISYYDIDPNHLEDHELEYELQLRHKYNLGTRRVKVNELKKLLQLERQGDNKPTSSHLQFENDFRFAVTAIDAIRNELHIGNINETPKNLLSCYKSRLLHSEQRLRRLNPQDQRVHEHVERYIRDTIGMLNTVLQGLGQEIRLNLPIIDREVQTILSSTQRPTQSTNILRTPTTLENLHVSNVESTSNRPTHTVSIQQSSPVSITSIIESRSQVVNRSASEGRRTVANTMVTQSLPESAVTSRSDQNIQNEPVIQLSQDFYRSLIFDSTATTGEQTGRINTRQIQNGDFGNPPTRQPIQLSRDLTILSEENVTHDMDEMNQRNQVVTQSNQADLIHFNQFNNIRPISPVVEPRVELANDRGQSRIYNELTDFNQTNLQNGNNDRLTAPINPFNNVSNIRVPSGSSVHSEDNLQNSRSNLPPIIPNRRRTCDLRIPAQNSGTNANNECTYEIRNPINNNYIFQDQYGQGQIPERERTYEPPRQNYNNIQNNNRPALRDVHLNDAYNAREQYRPLPSNNPFRNNSYPQSYPINQLGDPYLRNEVQIQNSSNNNASRDQIHDQANTNNQITYDRYQPDNEYHDFFRAYDPPVRHQVDVPINRGREPREFRSRNERDNYDNYRSVNRMTQYSDDPYRSRYSNEQEPYTDRNYVRRSGNNRDFYTNLPNDSWRERGDSRIPERRDYYEPQFRSNDNPYEYQRQRNHRNERNHGQQNRSQYRKVVTANQWKFYFSGEQKPLDCDDQNIHDFVSLSEMFGKSNHLTENELLDQMIHLLRGKARLWFLNEYRNIRYWPEFVEALKQRFLSRNYNYEMLREIQYRYQKRDEPVCAYINDMEARFKAMPVRQDEDFKIYTIRQNLLPYYQMPLSTMNIRSVGELTELCQRIENSKHEEQRRDRREQRQKLSYSENKSRRKNWVNTVEESTSSISDSESLSSEGELYMIQNDRRDKKDRRPYKDQRDSRSKKKPEPETNLEVNKDQPTQKVKCFNCEKEGHLWRDCKVPKKRNFCYRCGKAGVTCKDGHDCPRMVNFLEGEEERTPLSDQE